MTAVEWLRSKMLIECLEPSDELFEQAKEMEKEHIIDAVNNGWRQIDGKTYYNETFKNTEK